MEDVAAKILGPEESENDPFETIASEFASGMEAKDPKIMAKAMKAFMAMYEAQPETDD